MTRRLRLGLLASGVFVLFTILYLSVARSSHSNAYAQRTASSLQQSQPDADDASTKYELPVSVLTGGVIAPKLENATAKQELGRASWRLLHTMMARFPEKPTADDSLALQTYVQLFARLYPCGECAAHFQKLLGEYPPQTSSRNAAAGWACFVHNEVNKRLEKELFDCNKIGDFYDCGCGDEDKDGKKKKAATGAGDPDAADDSVDGFDDAKPEPEVVLSGKSANADAEGPIKLEKEGLSRGD